MNAEEALKHQIDVFERVYPLIMFGSDEEFVDASTELASTADRSSTGYTLAYTLAGVAKFVALEVVEAGQLPVSQHQVSAEEAESFQLVRAFVEAATTPDEPGQVTPPGSLMIFEMFEEDETGRDMSYLFAQLLFIVRDFSQQLKQALTDREGL